MVEFTNKSSSFTFVLLAYYLLPDNSVWSCDPNSFFAHVLSLICLHQQADILLLCDDFNGCVGDMLDVVKGIDDIPPRKGIDFTKK